MPSSSDELVELYAALAYGGMPGDRTIRSIAEAHVDQFKARLRRQKRRETVPDEPSRKVRSPEHKRILLIENDMDVANDYEDFLEAYFEVMSVSNADVALEITARFRDFDAVVIDIRMPHGKSFSSYQTVLGKRTGVELAKELIFNLPEAFFVALTNSTDATDVAWFEAKQFGFANKDRYKPAVFVRYLRRKLFNEKPTVFIVHGHDLKSAYDLRDYLRDVLKFDQSIILKDRASLNKTVIEKFEDWAEQSDIVFTLFTPDDPGTGTRGRARQNVVFEYGYFIGKFGRKSGKVIFLSKQGVEIPSDLAGLIPIDITDGIHAADKEIRNELREFLE